MIDYRPHLLPKVRSEAIKRAADGAPCTMRIASFIPGRKCLPPETTAFDHFRSAGKGVSTKTSDIHGAFGCDACHAILDGRDLDALAYIKKHHLEGFYLRLLAGLLETHTMLVMKNILIVPDGRLV